MNLQTVAVAPTRHLDKIFNSRFWVLDVLRGIAVLAVLCFHITPNPSADLDASYGFISWARYGGIFGVTVFFVISGFSIHLSQIKKANLNGNSIEWQCFFTQRLRRLYPAYFCTICIVIAINVVWATVRGRNPWNQVPDFWNLISHLLLIHPFSPQTFLGIIPALWFIGVQTHIYILYPIFWYMTQRWNTNHALFLALCFTVIARFFAQIIPLGSSLHPDWQLVLWMNAPQRWFEWCFGAWVAYQVSIQRRFDLLYTAIALATLILWLVTGRQYSIIYEPILGCLVGIFIWGIVSNQQKLPRTLMWQPVIYLGLVSYSVYLLHQIFVPYFYSALDQFGLSTATNFTVVLTLVLLVTLPLANSFNRFLK